jgi:hypothetical protein
MLVTDAAVRTHYRRINPRPDRSRRQARRFSESHSQYPAAIPIDVQAKAFSDVRVNSQAMSERTIF